MTEKQSLQGNIIRFDSRTSSYTIDQVLTLRFGEDNAFGEGGIESLHDPYLLCGMKEAVSRIQQAINTQEKIVIFGDYDVDGVTSTSILMHFFKKIKATVSYRLPHRVKDGYGLKSYFIDEIHTLGVTLIITVDCGTRDVEIIRYAKSLGIDVIVTDHHAVPDIIPKEAVAIINPKRPDCTYPFKHLSGAGVAYKLMMALAKEFFPEKEYKTYLQESIDIAAIGTVADCMSLTGENRIIVQEGLKQLKRSRSKGIRELIKDKINDDLDADIFGFFIGPRLNAAGRMDSPYKAVNLILNQEESVFATLQEIEFLNDKRRKLTHTFFEEALSTIQTDDNILFYHTHDIEHGILGIIAGKLTERFYKPSIVLIDEGDKLIASCRSPDYFDIVSILEKYKEFFVAFGGHKQAAGFTIKKSVFFDFKKQILEELNALDFSNYKKSIQVDKVVSFEEIGFKFLESISQYKPFGLGNPKPLFLLENISSGAVEYLGRGIEHISIKNTFGIKICGFGLGFLRETMKKYEHISLVLDLSEDTYNGKKGIMGKIVDVFGY